MLSPRIAFFGTPNLAVIVLNELEKNGLTPHVIISNPDAPKGRKMILTPPPVKLWAVERNIEILQPDSLRSDASFFEYLRTLEIDLCVVVAYGKIIPKDILSIPKFGTLNMHPSLLPELRGASPIRSAILNDIRETGVTIMVLDEELDHGPILAQERVKISTDAWPLRGQALDVLLAIEGGKLLSEVIPTWIRGEITPIPQDHEKATFCTKITKEMGEIDLNGNAYKNLLKIRAFDAWPQTFFYNERNGKRIRIKIIDAEMDLNHSLKILRVIPEGKNEMSYEDFLKSS